MAIGFGSKVVSYVVLTSFFSPILNNLSNTKNYLTSSDPHPGKLHIACNMARAHWCPLAVEGRKKKEGRRKGGKK